MLQVRKTTLKKFVCFPTKHMHIFAHINMVMSSNIGKILTYACLRLRYLRPQPTLGWIKFLNRSVTVLGWVQSKEVEA